MHAKWAVCWMLAMLGAWASAQTMSTIQSTGTATVEVPPEHVEFWLHREVKAESFSEAIKSVLLFGPALRKAMAERELLHYELDLSGPAIPLIGMPGARVSARLRFSMNPFNTREKGPALFAELCDQMTALAEQMDCLIEGPILGVDDRKAVEHNAIALATENALPVAQSVADLMNAQIAAVDHVAIEEPVWNEPPDDRALLPDLWRMTCTARVHMTYAFSAEAQ